MTDRIDSAIAESLQRILNRWNPQHGENLDLVVSGLKEAIQEEIEWLRL